MPQRHFFLAAARFFAGQGLQYEAVQSLRLGLVTIGESPDLFLRLFDLALQGHDAEEAGFWLAAFGRHPFIQQITTTPGAGPSLESLQLFLMRERGRRQQGEWWGGAPPNLRPFATTG